MKLNGKGQVTIPANLRERHGLRAGDEESVEEREGELVIVKTGERRIDGALVVARLRGTATTSGTSDELLNLLRGE